MKAPALLRFISEEPPGIYWRLFSSYYYWRGWFLLLILLMRSSRVSSFLGYYYTLRFAAYKGSEAFWVLFTLMRFPLEFLIMGGFWDLGTCCCCWPLRARFCSAAKPPSAYPLFVDVKAPPPPSYEPSPLPLIPDSLGTNAECKPSKWCCGFKLICCWLVLTAPLAPPL